MSERSLFRKIDGYFRREDTVLAKALKVVSPLEGKDYRESGIKRATELLIATPAALATLPMVAVLAAATKLEDGGSAFYVSDRIGKDGKPMPLIKIRVMREDADKEPWAIIHEMNQQKDGEIKDPRNTRIGRFMRQYELEELPQLWQVVQGDLSLVDIRAVAPYATEYMQDHMEPSTFSSWEEAYSEGSPGLFSLNSAINNHRKDDMTRDHFDLLYARKASLGLDFFVLYRTGLRMAGKLYEKAHALVE